MAGDAYEHRPVLLNEALEGLRIRADGIYVDGTFGRGGHARAILAALGPEGRLLVLDKDPEAVTTAHALFGDDPRLSVVHGSFAGIESLVARSGLQGRVDGVLLDLGVSSPQLEDASRGFSFLHDGPLDMRMDPTTGVSAADWLDSVPESELAEVLRTLGEERYHRRIARAIVRAREQQRIDTTQRLVSVIGAAAPTREKHKHPATRAFQAIRIYINRELEDLKVGLEQALTVLAAGGRLVVISFHSLEDRIVKRFMRDEARGDARHLPPDLPVREAELNARMRIIGKPVRAAEAELVHNPRARSAVMRVAERLA